jgi:RNA polymerase sigma factor (sigma-70 family)
LATNRTGTTTREIETLFGSGTLTGLDDRELLDRFQNADAGASGRAFAALVERHGPLVLRTCRAVLNDPADAQDAFQVTFLVLARKAGTVRRREALAGWLHGVAYRTACYARSSAARRRRHERAAASRSREAVEAVVPDDLAGLLHEEIERLPERFRRVLLLCEFEGSSLEDAARRLGCPVGTVKSRLARARERLKRGLSRRGVGPGFGLAASPALSNTLIQSTAALAVRDASGRGAAVAAALAAWEASVIRGMLMGRVKVWVAVLSCGLAAAGAGLAAFGQPGAPKKSGGDRKPKVEVWTDQYLAALARFRIDAARRSRDDLWRLYMGGESTLRDYLEAQDRYSAAVRESCPDDEQLLRALAVDHRVGARLEDHVRRLYERDQTTRSDLALAEFYRLTAALRLAEARTGRKARLDTPVPAELLDGSKIKPLLDKFLDISRIDAESLRNLLVRKVSIKFDAPPTLEAALKALKAASVGLLDDGVPIYVDPAGLQKVGLAMSRTVQVGSLSGTLEQALHQLLDPLGLTFSATDGMVSIRAK